MVAVVRIYPSMKTPFAGLWTRKGGGGGGGWMFVASGWAYTPNFAVQKCTSFTLSKFKGELHPKMITSYLVVFGTLSQMLRVRGACDKPF